MADPSTVSDAKAMLAADGIPVESRTWRADLRAPADAGVIGAAALVVDVPRNAARSDLDDLATMDRCPGWFVESAQAEARRMCNTPIGLARARAAARVAAETHR